MIEKMLTVSTAHMPGQDASFGDLRVVDDEFGYIVMLLSICVEDLPEGVPNWLWPLYQHARNLECRYIYFDRDVPTIDGFQTWDW